MSPEYCSSNIYLPSFLFLFLLVFNVMLKKVKVCLLYFLFSSEMSLHNSYDCECDCGK